MQIIYFSVNFCLNEMLYIPGEDVIREYGVWFGEKSNSRCFEVDIKPSLWEGNFELFCILNGSLIVWLERNEDAWEIDPSSNDRMRFKEIFWSSKSSSSFLLSL